MLAQQVNSWRVVNILRRGLRIPGQNNLHFLQQKQLQDKSSKTTNEEIPGDTHPTN